MRPRIGSKQGEKKITFLSVYCRSKRTPTPQRAFAATPQLNAKPFKSVYLRSFAGRLSEAELGLTTFDALKCFM